MSRVQGDVFQLQQLLEVAVITLGDLIGLVWIVAALLLMSMELGLISLAAIPLLIIVMALWQPLARKAFIRVRSADLDSERLPEPEHHRRPRRPVHEPAGPEPPGTSTSLNLGITTWSQHDSASPSVRRSCSQPVDILHRGGNWSGPLLRRPDDRLAKRSKSAPWSLSSSTSSGSSIRSATSP